MNLNGVMALIFCVISPNFRVRCRHKTIIRPTSVSKSTFNSLFIVFLIVRAQYSLVDLKKTKQNYTRRLDRLWSWSAKCVTTVNMRISAVAEKLRDALCLRVIYSPRGLVGLCLCTAGNLHTLKLHPFQRLLGVPKFNQNRQEFPRLINHMLAHCRGWSH